MPDEALLSNACRHVRHGRYREAIEILQGLLAEDDTDVVLHDAIGSAYFLAGDNDSAARHFKRITRLTNNPGKAYINLGAVYNRIGEFQKAVDSIRKGIQLEKKNVEGYYNLGVAHRRLGQLGMAVAAYKEALRLDPQFAEAHQNLGNVYLDQGLPEQAATQYRKALELKPTLERAKTGLKDAERAAQLARQAISPFGRLVDTSVGQHADESGLRPLSSEEREIDRRRLHELSKSIETTAADLVANLSGPLDDSLVQLERRLAMGKIDGVLLEAGDEFAAAITAVEETRRLLRRKVLELVAHEEIQHAPG